MTYPIRPITPDEFEAYARSGATAFGWQESPEEIERGRGLLEIDRSLAAFDGSRIIGTAGAYSFELTVPGNCQVPAAGVSWVSVFPTHRRQGVLTAMMRRQMDDVRERGEPLAILYSSESLIYGRFGYGTATSEAHFTIDKRHARLIDDGAPEGSIELVDALSARDLLPGIFDRWRHTIPGQVNRFGAWWDRWVQDPPGEPEEGFSRRFYALHQTADATPDGYVTYQMKVDWQDGIPGGTVRVRELVTESSAAYSALWRYCLSLDLTQTVEVPKRPPDEQLRWMLADPRRLRVTNLHDGLWVRIVDVPTALAGRRYTTPGSLVIEVHDDFLSDQPARYQVDGGPDGAVCRPSQRSPDLTMRTADLGALYLGNVSPAVLAQAGRIIENRSGSIATALTMFTSDRAPWCSTHF